MPQAGNQKHLVDEVRQWRVHAIAELSDDDGSVQDYGRQIGPSSIHWQDYPEQHASVVIDMKQIHMS